MIDRSRLTLFLRPLWLLATASATAALFAADFLVLESEMAVWTWTALATALGLPIITLTVIGILRGEQLWSAFLHKAGRTCPKCSRNSAPHVRCSSCSRLLTELRPSVYGVMYARCLCGATLPAMDLLGRRRLAKVCPHCSADLANEDLGLLPLYSLAIVGSTSSGKSNVMIAAIWQLMEMYGPKNGFEVSFGSSDEESAYRHHVEWFKKGLAMQKTLSLPVPRAFTLKVSADDGWGCLLYLYDAAGEDFEDERRVTDHPLSRYDGILLVVDPFAEEGMRRSATEPPELAEVQRTNPAAVEVSEILGRLVNAMERVLKVSVTGVFPLPLAVVVTKVDAFGLGRKLRLGQDRMPRSHMSLATAVLCAESEASQVRAFLLSLGLGNVVRIVESRFARYCYFAVSALGRSADPADRSPFRPRGLLGPLIWLCYHTDAFGDRDSFERVFINFNVAYIRCLRGFEGGWAQVGSWVLLAILLALICLAVVFVPPFLLLMGGGMQGALLLALYGCLLYQLVRHRFKE